MKKHFHRHHLSSTNPILLFSERVCESYNFIPKLKMQLNKSPKPKHNDLNFKDHWKK